MKLGSTCTRINLYQNDGKKKVCRRLGTAHEPKHTTSSVKHVEQCDGMSMSSSGTGLLVFSEDVTEEEF